MHWTQEPGAVPEADRIAFVEANAVALVNDRDARIARLRAEVTRLLNSQRELRRHAAALREQLAQQVARRAGLVAEAARLRRLLDRTMRARTYQEYAEAAAAARREAGV